MADYRQWSFRGFFGFTSDDGFEDLGIVWGKDIAVAATSTVQMPLTKNLLGMGSSLQLKVKKMMMSGTKLTEHFYLGQCVSTGAAPGTPFIIRNIAFSSSTGRLSGLKIKYSDEKEVIHGAYTPANEAQRCDVTGPIIAAKLTVAETKNTYTWSRSNSQIQYRTPYMSFVDSVELVCGDENGKLPLEPLDASTVRYLGDHPPEDRLEVVCRIIEQAPRLADANWTLRGFYGEESEGVISRLGLIWGYA
ncbi:hypothetical protein AA313_de0207552 [Arthrobotrys entomopaga]|nr:hypothetical protein AA313_de0207552 [Arthrobotrys entomopaga]